MPPTATSCSHPSYFEDLARQGGGHLSVPAEAVATVLVLRVLEGLSDREAISALRRDTELRGSW